MLFYACQIDYLMQCNDRSTLSSEDISDSAIDYDVQISSQS